MTEFRVGCSPITGTIYAGTVRENKKGVELWTSNRHEVTEQAVDAVVFRLNQLPNKTEQYKWKLDGVEYILKLEEYHPKGDEGHPQTSDETNYILPKGKFIEYLSQKLGILEGEAEDLICGFDGRVRQ